MNNNNERRLQINRYIKDIMMSGATLDSNGSKVILAPITSEDGSNEVAPIILVVGENKSVGVHDASNG